MWVQVIRLHEVEDGLKLKICSNPTIIHMQTQLKGLVLLHNNSYVNGFMWE